MKELKQILLVVVTLSILGSCGKYEDGPGISFRSKKSRLVGDWRLVKYEQNGVEKTGELLFDEQYIERFMDDGTYTREYTRFDGTTVYENGTWEFSDKKDKIFVRGIAPIELTNDVGFVTDTMRTIWMLRNDEIRYRYDVGQYTHEFHLKTLE